MQQFANNQTLYLIDSVEPDATFELDVSNTLGTGVTKTGKVDVMLKKAGETSPNSSPPFIKCYIYI